MENPNGLPMAITVSPIIRSLDSPISMAGKGSFEVIRRSARSESGSAPTICASNSRSSFNTTVIVPVLAMTWVFVRMKPRSPSMITPEPRLLRLYLRSKPGSKKSLKKESKKGSIPNPENGLVRLRTSYSELMFTTAGLTFLTARTTAFSRLFPAQGDSWGIERRRIKAIDRKLIDFINILLLICTLISGICDFFLSSCVVLGNC